MTTKKIDAPVIEDTPAEPQANLGNINLSDLGDAMGKAVAAGIAAGTRRKVSFGEYQARGGNSPFHPDPNKRLKLNRSYFQNGRQIELATAYDAEVELLNQITHSGRYIDRLVEVVVSQDGSEEVVEIRFSNKSQYAFDLKGKARDFTEMMQQIIAAQKLEREESEEHEQAKQERKRLFGNSKATRDAMAAAGR